MVDEVNAIHTARGNYNASMQKKGEEDAAKANGRAMRRDWSYDAGNNVEQLVDAGHVLLAFVREGTGSLVAIDKKTAKLLWEQPAGFLPHKVALFDAKLGSVFLLREDDLGQGSLVALNVTTGNALWSSKVGRLSRNFGTPMPAFDDKRIYVGVQGKGNKGLLLALSKRTGEKLWETALDAQPAPIVVTSRGICTQMVDGRIACLSPGDGELLWSYDGPNDPGSMTRGRTLAAMGDRLYLVLDRVIYGIEVDKGLSFKQNLPSPNNLPLLFSSPVVSAAGDKVLLQSGGLLVAYQATTGETAWTAPTPRNDGGTPSHVSAVPAGSTDYGQTDHFLLGVSDQTGAVEWTAAFGEDEGPDGNSPISGFAVSREDGDLFLALGQKIIRLTPGPRSGPVPSGPPAGGLAPAAVSTMR